MKAQANANEVQKLTGKIPVLSRFISKAEEKSLPFFKVLRKAKQFKWDTSAQRAFEELKKYLAGLPLLVKPIQGDTLYLYFSTTPKLLALYSFVKREESKCQFTILVKYLMEQKNELSEYDISYLPRTTIKAQALADFISEMMGTPMEEASKVEKWLLHVDGSSTTQGSGEGVVITSPHKEYLEFAIKFGFKTSNNEAEYEAMVIGMRMAHDVRVRHLVAYLDSQLIVKPV
ncbi:hypothetical protein Sango_2436700 [Sesamum angolense]|uniref:RNase H type-1 domain-containing protein n=1 Tax=Sesamum angolense TaxID=2727404 RepID=A0AAE1W7S9_9LAMI|nr:hypothetical protein Sango_2436700 [Sesamum angolense]